MTARIGILAAVAVFFAALIGAMFAAPPPTPVAVAATAPRQDMPQVIGETLNVYYSDSLKPELASIDKIADMGFNSLQIATSMFQRDGASEDVQIKEGPGFGPSADDLIKLIKHAKQRGLIVALMPQINFIQPRGNEWRGKIQPNDWGPWWRSYTKAIAHFADIAKAGGADLFYVGCELLSTQRDAGHWRRVIAVAHQHFPGALSYSTNWDSYQNVGFWPSLDAIGISSYWDMTTMARDPEHPTPAELAARWAQIRDQVVGYARQQGRPVLFTELGYPSLPWALRDPWNYINSDSIHADPQAQAAGYRAFLQAWGDTLTPPRAPETPPAAAAMFVQPHRDASSVIVSTPRARWHLPSADVAGVLFYRWDPHHRGGKDDTGYGILGKPTEQLVAHWLKTGQVATDKHR